MTVPSVPRVNVVVVPQRFTVRVVQLLRGSTPVLKSTVLVMVGAGFGVNCPPVGVPNLRVPARCRRMDVRLGDGGGLFMVATLQPFR